MKKQTTPLPGAARVLGVLVALGIACPQAAAVVVYDEAVSGDLSDNGLAPTVISVSTGSNEIRGTVNEGGMLSRDFWTITIGPGQRLDQIVFTEFGPTLDTTFLGIEFGPQISDGETGSGLDGGAHLGTPVGAMVGDDVLDDLGSAAILPSPGFPVPLGPGTYSFWFQEGVDINSTFDYAFDFQISAVPEPSAAVLVLGALIASGGRARRLRGVRVS